MHFFVLINEIITLKLYAMDRIMQLTMFCGIPFFLPITLTLVTTLETSTFQLDVDIE